MGRGCYDMKVPANIWRVLKWSSEWKNATTYNFHLSTMKLTKKNPKRAIEPEWITCQLGLMHRHNKIKINKNITKIGFGLAIYNEREAERDFRTSELPFSLIFFLVWDDMFVKDILLLEEPPWLVISCRWFDQSPIRP